MKLTDTMIRQLGRVCIPFSTTLEAKTTTGQPVVIAGVEYGVLVPGTTEIIRGEIYCVVDSATMLGQAVKQSSDAFKAFSDSLPLVAPGTPIVTSKTSADGTRTISATVPKAEVIPPLGNQLAEPVTPAIDPVKRRSAPKASQPPVRPPESESESAPDPVDDSQPRSPTGLTIDELKSKICTYGKDNGSLKGKRFGDLMNNNLEWLASGEEFEKFLDRPGFSDLRLWAKELLDLKRILGE